MCDSLFGSNVFVFRYVLKTKNSTPPVPAPTPTLEPTGQSFNTPPPSGVPPKSNDMGAPIGSSQPFDSQQQMANDVNPLKEIQQLTGTLAQKVREFAEQMESKDLKYVLNSIISAVPMDKLEPADKNDVLTKFKSKETPEGELDENDTEWFEDDEGENLLGTGPYDDYTTTNFNNSISIM